MSREDLTYFITTLRTMEERAEAAEARAAETESALKLAATLAHFEAAQRGVAEQRAALLAEELDGWQSRFYAEKRARLEIAGKLNQIIGTAEGLQTIAALEKIVEEINQ